MSELHDLLAQATDGIENPRLEQAALQTARRRRTRRRGAAAAGLASVLVVAVFVGTQVGDERAGGLPPVAPPTPTPSAPETSVPPDTAKVWPRWDPRQVDDLPAAPDRLAPALPDVIDPPDSSPLLSDEPVDAAVVAVQQGDVAQLLGTDGEWRSVPLEGRYPRIALSPGGTRLAVYYYFDNTPGGHDYGVTVHDLATGESRQLETPPTFRPWDDTGWSFLDEDALLLTSGPQSFVVVVEDGYSEETGYRSGLSRVVDASGAVLVSADFDKPNVLFDYVGAEPRQVSMDRTGRLSRIQADEDTVVGTTYDAQPFNVVVADRKTLTPQFRLPVLDFEGNYSNWGLGPVALADDGTVLLRVAAIGRQVDGFRLVAWDPETGDLSIVTTTALPVEASVVFAQGMLSEVG